MRTFPQELADKVIDELAGIDRDHIAPYSLVSRAWVTRAQQHHFKCIFFNGTDGLRKWCRKIAPDPAGVSCHTRRLVLVDVNMSLLEDFEVHIRAFTRVEGLEIARCDSFLRSLSVVERLAPMGSSLVELRISRSPTTPHIITSLLAALPQLKSLITVACEVIDDTSGANSLTQVIPFFEGSNSLVLRSGWEQRDPPGPPDWIPPSARFGDLKIDMTYFLYKAVLVNRWLSSSCMTLTSLTVHGNPDPLRPDPFTPLDLSQCHALARLHVPISFRKPGTVVETILPSIASSQLSYISLQLNVIRFDYLEIDYSAWAVAEKHFCRLAKRFSAGNPGEKMVVSIFGEDDWYSGSKVNHCLKVFDCKEFLPRLKEEATFSLPAYI